MKRFICASLAAVMFMTSTAFADTAANVYIGDTLVSYTDQTPVIIDNRTYVPIRDVFEAAGFKVEWDAENKVVNLNNDYCQIALYTKTNSMLSMNAEFDLNYKKLENPVKIVNDRTLLPLREILEGAGYSLDWDAETKSAKVTDNNDYEALKENLELLEDMFSQSKEKYEFDSSKPAGEFTPEEYAFIDNLLKVRKEIEGAADLDSFGGDMSKMTPENIALISKLVNSYTAKFSDVECPESLDDMDKKLQDVYNSLIDNVVAIAQFSEDNPDVGDETFGVMFMLIMGFAAKAGIAIQPLENICRERNIDIKSVFADKYSEEDLLQFGIN